MSAGRGRGRGRGAGEKGKSTRGASKKKTSGGMAEEMSLDSLVFPGAHCSVSLGQPGYS